MGTVVLRRDVEQNIAGRVNAGEVYVTQTTAQSTKIHKVLALEPGLAELMQNCPAEALVSKNLLRLCLPPCRDSYSYKTRPRLLLGHKNGLASWDCLLFDIA